MRLKVLTTAFMVLSLALLLGMPWMLRSRPKDGDRREVVAFARRLLVYEGALVIALAATGITAILIVRRAREEYRKASHDNLQILLEGTLEAHRRKESVEPPESA